MRRLTTICDGQAGFSRQVFRTLVLLLALASPAFALVGGAQPASDIHAQALVMIVGSRGNFCTGTAIARDVVLTAAHCVPVGPEYRLLDNSGGTPQLKAITRIERHPHFDIKAFATHRATADVAVLKLADPLPGSVAPVLLGEPAQRIAPGDRVVVAGYGVAMHGDGRSSGTARSANLAATGKPGTLQIRLVDPATRGEASGLGACTGDSGAPVFAEIDGRAVVIGVVSWSTGPKLSEGCGGLTGVTPLVHYRKWIEKTARELSEAQM